MTLWLEIGPDERRLDGPWVTLDAVPRPGVVDHVCRWGEEKLPFGDNTFELVYASHVLEHIPWFQTVDSLREVWRILAPGGTIELHVPDFHVLATAAEFEKCGDIHAEADLNHELHWMHWVAERLFHMGPEAQWHRACFNASHLRWCLQRAGFSEICSLPKERGSDHGIVDLGMVAIKPCKESPLRLIRQYDEDQIMSAADEPGLPIVAGAEELSPCHSRREFDSSRKVFFCAHPNVHTADGLVSSDICKLCQRPSEPPPEEFRLHAHIPGNGRGGPCWFLGEQTHLRECTTCRGNVRIKVFNCGHVDHEETTADECLRCADFDQRLWRGAVRKWAVGVTTAPRKKPTLARTLESLLHAGWQSPILFAEPDSIISGSNHEIVWRTEKLGAWPNWYLGLVELYQRSPEADAYLMVQDDVLFCRNLRSYLEAELWPEEQVGVVSLYNPLKVDRTTRGFERYSSQGGLPCALALVFPNTAARLLLADMKVLLHRRRGPTIGRRLVDTVVGQWAERSKWGAYLHWPSLCQHIGETTTVGTAAQDLVVRRAEGFVGEAFDALSLSQRSIQIA